MTSPDSTASDNAVTPSVSPYLTVGDAKAAIDFYTKAFGAEKIGVLETSNGKVVHAALKINGASVLLSDDFPEYNDGKSNTPIALGGTPVTIHLTVPDVDKAFKRAVDAGATVHTQLADQFWGDRYGLVQDPFGHRWSLASPVHKVTPEELQAFVDG